MSLLGKFSEWFSHLIEGDNFYTVTVKRGDTLSEIAEALTGNAEDYKRIAAANPDKQWDERYTIYPGEVLKIPKD